MPLPNEKKESQFIKSQLNTIRARIGALHPDFFVDNKTWKHDAEGTLDIIRQSLELQRQKFVGEVVEYQFGFVRDDGYGQPERAPEWQVIEDLLNHLRKDEKPIPLKVNEIPF